MTGSIDRGGMDIVRPRRGLRLMSTLAGASLAFAACEGNEQAQPTSTTAPAEVTLPGESPASVPAKLATIVFDDLGGGSPIIAIYRGPGESANDRMQLTIEGQPVAYKDGQKAGADCKVIDGREVPSDTSAGEEFRLREEWFHIPAVDGYAAATYTEKPDQALAQLDECPK